MHKFSFYRFNVVEQRGWLAMIGIGSIGLGIGTSYGLAGLFGIPNTGMNSILPFLLLGIGIDDMFVIVQSFENIKVYMLMNLLFNCLFTLRYLVKEQARLTISEQLSTLLVNFLVINEKFHPDRFYHYPVSNVKF